MSDKSIEELLKQKKIFQIINSRIVQTGPQTPLSEVIQLMVEAKSGYAVISENEKVVGIFTETDVTRKILSQSIDLNSPVSSFMTSNPTLLTPTDTVGEAIDIMAKKTIYHLPLVDENTKLKGMLSVRTLIRFLAEYYPNEVYNLPPDPSQVASESEGG